MDETSTGYDRLPMDWVGDWSGRRAAITPDRPAVFEPESGRRLTFREMDWRACRAAHYLVHGLGLERGDRIALLTRNRPEALDLYFACGKTGVILAPLSYRLAPRELNDLVRRTAPKALFHEACFTDLADALMLPEGARRIEIDDGRGRYAGEVEAAPATDENRPLALADPFLYVHTGGTTATPKICVVSHRQMVWNAIELLATSGGALGPQRELLTFPLFHIGGWNTVTPVYYAGGYTVLLRAFDPALALETIAAERITHFGAVEAMLQFLAADPGFAAADLSSLEGITTAGAPCAARSMQPFWDRGIPVHQSYGLTEAGPSNFMYVPRGDALEESRAYCDSIGTSMFHTDYRIVDPDSLEPVAPGETGVLLMRSPHNFDGYLDEPERTGKTLLPGGWVYSGDLARRDDAGRVRIVGRADHMFISGGENISPEEIEQVLMGHPAVAQAAVVGIDDPRWGRVPAAAVVAGDGAGTTAEEIRQRLAGELAKFKVPRRIVFVDALPLTGAGKIDRNAIKERIMKDGQANG